MPSEGSLHHYSIAHIPRPARYTTFSVKGWHADCRPDLLSQLVPCKENLAVVVSKSANQEVVFVWHYRFLRVIIVSSFREEARGQKQVVGLQHDLAVLFAEASQNIAGAPSNARLADLFRAAAPRKMRTNVWARLRGQQEQLTIQVVLRPDCEQMRNTSMWACASHSASNSLKLAD